MRYVHKLKQMKPKLGLGAFFYVIQPGNGLGLFNSCLGLHGRVRPENFAGYYEEVHSSLISETMLDNLKHQMHEYVSCTP